MELKWDKDLSDEELDALSVEALDQINKKGYDTEMREEGVADIICDLLASSIIKRNPK